MGEKKEKANHSSRDIVDDDWLFWVVGSNFRNLIILLCVIFIIQVVNWPLGHLIYTELRWWSFIKSCLTLVLKRYKRCSPTCAPSGILSNTMQHIYLLPWLRPPGRRIKSAEDTDLTFFMLFTLGKLSVPSQFKMDAVFMMLCLWQNLQQLLIWTSHILTGSPSALPAAAL